MSKNIIKIKLRVNKDGNKEVKITGNNATHKDVFAVMTALQFHLDTEIDKQDEEVKSLEDLIESMEAKL